MKKVWKELRLLIGALIIGGIIAFLASAFDLLDEHRSYGTGRNRKSYTYVDEEKATALVVAPYLLLLSYRVLRWTFGSIHGKAKNAEPEN